MTISNINCEASKPVDSIWGSSWTELRTFTAPVPEHCTTAWASTRLTLPPGLSNKMFTDAGWVTRPGPAGCVNPITAANAARCSSDILNNTHAVPISVIRRDTASVDYRYTPDRRWDFRANYSHTAADRHPGRWRPIRPKHSGVAVEVPKPVADTTQNYGAIGRICRHIVLESEIQCQGGL